MVQWWSIPRCDTQMRMPKHFNESQGRDDTPNPFRGLPCPQAFLNLLGQAESVAG